MAVAPSALELRLLSEARKGSPGTGHSRFYCGAATMVAGAAFWEGQQYLYVLDLSDLSGSIEEPDQILWGYGLLNRLSWVAAAWQNDYYMDCRSQPYPAQ